MRIVSLAPAATEIVAALGATGALAGISHDSDYPEELLRGTPRVTRSTIDAGAAPGDIDRMVRAASARAQPLHALDIAAIAALAPDVILTQGLCEVCAISDADVRTAVQDFDRPPLVVALSATTLEGVMNDIHRVAAAIERSPLGDVLVMQLEERLRRVHERLVVASVPRPRVAVLEWTDPIYNAGHWVPQMVRRAGGIEVLANAGERSREIAMADVAAAKPDTVVIAPCGYDVERAAADGSAALLRDGWEWMRRQRVWAIDAGGLISRPGPRLVDGVETLAEIFHPAVFPPPARSRAVALSAG
jgi:iron complex transport system substrate-binding protein